MSFWTIFEAPEIGGKSMAIHFLDTATSFFEEPYCSFTKAS